MAVSGRTAFVVCALLATASGSSGCTVGSKSFYMDSVSRMPFFGFELKERKPKDSNPYRSISRSSMESSRIERTLQLGPKSKTFVATSDIPSAASSTTAFASVTADSNGSNSRPADGKSIDSAPLPLRPMRRTTSDGPSSDGIIEFQ